MREKIITLPNIISATRILTIPALYIALFSGRKILFFILLLYCGISDMLDGFIARRFNQCTEFGKTLDTLADLPLFVSLPVFSAVLFPEIISPFLMPILLFTGIRGAYILYLIIRYKKPLIPHTLMNKLTGLLVFLLVLVSVFFPSPLLITIVLAQATLAFLEEVLIHIFFGVVDMDTKSLLHLLKKRTKKES